MSELPKVGIGLSSTDQVYADFAMSFAALVGASGGAAQIALLNQKGCYVHANRRKLAEEALRLGLDYLFFIDTDMTMPPATLARLLSHRKDIVGGTYIKRVPPFNVLGSRLDDARELPQSGLVRMGEMPTGCLLIDCRVLRAMQERDDAPLFQTPVERRGDQWVEVGEDIDFCRRAVAQGFEIWCDMDVSWRLGHVGTHAFNMAEAAVAMAVPEPEAIAAE